MLPSDDNAVFLFTMPYKFSEKYSNFGETDELSEVIAVDRQRQCYSNRDFRLMEDIYGGSSIIRRYSKFL